MKFRNVAIAFIACFASTLFAHAGTVGVFRVADGQILDVSDNGSQILIDQDAFASIQTEVNVGDTVVIEESNWKVISESKGNLKLSLDSNEAADIELVPVEE
jgi:hypothetical protein